MGLKILPTFTKDHPDDHCRLIQELPGSRTTKIGRSTANPMHVQWTMARAKEILKDKSLTGVGVNIGLRNAPSPENLLAAAEDLHLLGYM